MLGNRDIKNYFLCQLKNKNFKKSENGYNFLWFLIPSFDILIVKR